MIKMLIDSHDICFFIEHWLGEEEAYLFNEVCTKHSIIFDSDFSFLENERIKCKHTN